MHRKVLKTKDPVIFSIGWRRYQTTLVYAIEDRNGRHRMLNPFWGPLAPPNTGVVAVQNLANNQMRKRKLEKEQERKKLEAEKSKEEELSRKRKRREKRERYRVSRPRFLSKVCCNSQSLPSLFCTENRCATKNSE
ncbi:hypothetical protein NC653_019620 [Populus alba x Populus x berolinensis]|uniref:Ribosome biogenesis protein BMS1/TSR1 C-terminal domain-containing protein n=1 Tax=Populus alba x Populus x berolinensis TaxID=444605 RepID=A0AAD6QJE4_9ROSI|nr:hypothetical protein NC653_019620 [Populus alba x Populus x berolinensis]